MNTEKRRSGKSGGEYWALFKTMRIIDEREGTLYLWRLRLFQTPLFGVFVHKIVAPDPGEDMHDHPYNFASLLLWGSYEEVVCEPEDKRYQGDSRIVRWFNVKRAETLHRITTLRSRCVWSLLFVGRRRRGWGFRTRIGWLRSRDYLTVDPFARDRAEFDPEMAQP